MTDNTIWHRRRQLQRQREELHQQLMEEYDRTKYRPQMLALQAECANSPTGHQRGTHHDNGLGWHWWYCGQCGARHGQEQHTEY